MAHPRYTAYYMVLHVSMRSISQWMQRSTFTHTLWRTIVAFEHAKYHVMYADGVCGARVWAVAVPTRRTGPRRRPGAGRPLNRTPATGRRSECVALSSGLSWALCATAARTLPARSPLPRFLRGGVRYKVMRFHACKQFAGTAHARQGGTCSLFVDDSCVVHDEYAKPRARRARKLRYCFDTPPPPALLTS
jgi:hypothetical protein